MKESTRVTVISIATGAFVGSFCHHFGFSPIEHWTCVISAAVLMGMII